MNLYILIFGLTLCGFTTSLFLYVRTNKGGLSGVFTKIFASFVFVAFAVLLSATKTNVAFYGSFAVSFLILGLVCGLIGDILLDLKVIYPFHQDKHLVAGMSAFSVGHLFYILSLGFLINNQTPFFSWEVLRLVLIFLGASVLLTILMWLVSVKFLSLDFKKFTAIVNIYTFILIFVTALSVYFSFVITTLPLYILAIGFVFFLGSDIILSKQYFGNKQDNKTLIFINHLTYYLAQILIAMFIYFV